MLRQMCKLLPIISPAKIILSPAPLQNVVINKSVNIWSIVGTPARIALLPSCGKIPSGWILLRGTLLRRGHDHSARLIVEVDDGLRTFSYPLPVSRKGAILELIKLPAGVIRLELEPMRSSGECELDELILTPVGPLERIVRMLRRVIPMFFKQPSDRRVKAGLRFFTPIVDLCLAYKIAGSFRAYAPSQSYSQWLKKFDNLSEVDRNLINGCIGKWKNAPRIEVIVPALDFDLASLQRTIDSIRVQLYKPAQVTVISPEHLPPGSDFLMPPGVSCQCVRLNNGSNDLVERFEGEGGAWVIVIASGCVLSEHACYWLASEVIGNRNLCMIYSDHDKFSKDFGRVDPVFNPDWSVELLNSTNYIGLCAAVRADIYNEAGGFVFSEELSSSCHDLWLRVTEQLQPQSIKHVPALLWHLSLDDRYHNGTSLNLDNNPVASHLRRCGVAATVQPLVRGNFRVKYNLPGIEPLVSIIVPTRDKVEYLQACVNSIFSVSTYTNFELIVVDNLSYDRCAIDYLNELRLNSRIRVLHYDKQFNYSAINNFAVSFAHGSVLCLLNNDTQVISAEWIQEMLGHLLQANVGVVGAKLFFPDGRVQHAGDTIGPGGCADHLHFMIANDDPGYCDRAILAQDLSAVTAACLMTWRHLYQALGGLDEHHLPISFNDVDYCLRVREAGFRVVWTPYAQLYHHESISRGRDADDGARNRGQREANYMRRRWQNVMFHDPFYNPNLSYLRPDFSLNNAPLVEKPWHSQQ